MKATAIAPANIAFIKYWGKKDPKLRLPLNNSISMNLSNCLTTTTVEFSDKYKEDYFELMPYNHRKKLLERNFAIKNEEKERVINHLDRIRKLAGIKTFSKVISQNNFPKSSGIASSASGFAALTVAGCAAAGLAMSEKELSILARTGSGSACRSIPDGLVEWKQGETDKESFAYSIYSADYWDIRDIIILVQNSAKKTSSSRGMENPYSSSFMESRLKNLPDRIRKIKLALKDKNFSILGKTIEEEAINMHAVMMTQEPPLFYWTKETIEIINAVQKWRENGFEVFFTIDAGPNVHLICEGKNEEKVITKVKQTFPKVKYIVNRSAKGARVINEHLF